MLRFGEKTVWFVVVEKPSAHPGKNEVAPKTSKFTCKCHACSKWISKTHVEVLVHKHHHQILQHHAKSRKHQKIYRSQMLFHHSTAKFRVLLKNDMVVHQIPTATPSWGGTWHMFTVSTGVYTSIPRFATIPMQLGQESFQHAAQCIVYVSTSSAKPLWGSAHEVISSQQLQMNWKYLCT